VLAFFSCTLFSPNCQNNSMAAEEDRKALEEALGKNTKVVDELNCLLKDTSVKLNVQNKISYLCLCSYSNHLCVLKRCSCYSP
jgi:hypothetical protein